MFERKIAISLENYAKLLIANKKFSELREYYAKFKNSLEKLNKIIEG